MGQCCCAGSRIFVQEGIYDEFVKRSAARAKSRVVCDPWEAKCEQGKLGVPWLANFAFKIYGY